MSDTVEVNKKLLLELEAFGFSPARAARALHHSGNTSLEAAVNWLIDHENDTDIDEMPLVVVNIDIESPQPYDVTEVMKIKANELRDHASKMKEVKNLEKEREKERIRAGKELLEAKRIAEENERKCNLTLKKAEKEEEQRARKNILQKLEADKLERRRRLGLTVEQSVPKASPPVIHKNGISLSESMTKADQMNECLRAIRRNFMGDDARAKRAFQTLLKYVGNVAKNPGEEKFRKIRLINPLFNDRVGSLTGGIEFLELCGFQRTEGNEFLFLPQNNVDMAALFAAASVIKSAMTNPFFGLLSRASED